MFGECYGASLRLNREVVVQINENFEVQLKISTAFQMSPEFLSGNWQYWSNIHEFPTTSLFSGRKKIS
jgi:hypothetical protein